MISDATSGLILKTDTLTGRSCLFSPSLGKVHVINKGSRLTAQLTPGMEVGFVIQSRRSTHYIVSDLHILSLPTIMDSQDLLWLHHILELHYFFLPEGYGQREEYDFLKNYTTLGEQTHALNEQAADRMRHVGVLHFLSQTGFYGDERLERFATLFQQALDNPEVVAQAPLQNSALAMIIVRYLEQHPQFRLFKTTQFIYALKKPRTPV